MSLGLFIFFLMVVVTIVAAVAVVTSQNLVNAAMWLMVALFGAAIAFVLLQATYIAVIQVLVYIGAIAILIVYTIMLTRDPDEKHVPGVNKQWPIAAALSLVLFLGLAYFYYTLPQTNVLAPALDGDLNAISQLGALLVSPDAYVLPFELASILLLAALIGSIVVAWRK